MSHSDSRSYNDPFYEREDATMNLLERIKLSMVQ